MEQMGDREQRCNSELSLLLTASSDVFATVSLSTSSDSYSKLLNTPYLNPLWRLWKSKVDEIKFGIWKRVVQIIVGQFIK
jgi:hypothetical protein